MCSPPHPFLVLMDRSCGQEQSFYCSTKFCTIYFTFQQFQWKTVILIKLTGYGLKKS